MPKLIAKPWNDNFQKRYDAIYNFLTNKRNLTLNKDNFLIGNKKEVFKLITENKDWSDGTKESYLLACARWLNNHNDKRGAKMFGEAGIAIKIKRDEQEGHNTLDAKEVENFRHHQYFVDLIEAMKERSQLGNQTQLQNMKYLLLVILTYQPPLRTSFYTSALVISQKKENDNLNNFVLINRRGGHLKVQFIVNKDKASNYKTYKMNKNLSYIDVSEEASKAINESLVNFPRNHLFEINEKPITQSTLLNWLREITGVSKIDIDIMRSSYITWYHETHPKYIDRDKLSKVMRHSQATALRNYKKVFDVAQEPEEELKNCNQIMAQKELQIRDLQNKLTAYEEAKPDQLHFRKMRRDVIFQLNKFKRTPRQATVDRYDIKIVEGKYV
jgi:hypothetical protein